MRLLSLFLALLIAAQAEAPPRFMLWAWEQPLDLRFLTGKTDLGVAYLAATAFVDARGIKVRYRAAPLRIPPGMFRMPVLRIEARGVPASHAELVELCERLIADGRSEALQIDFDAPAQFRPMYDSLLRQIRKAHGKNLFLSMTVLAGWCDQPWFTKLPIDEHVVMLFRMGLAGKAIANRLRQSGGFLTPACQSSLGYSTDDTLAPRLPSKRRYGFSPKPWSEVSISLLSPAP